MARHSQPRQTGSSLWALDLQARNRAAQFIFHKMALLPATTPQGEAGSGGSSGYSQLLVDWLDLGVSVTRLIYSPVSVSHGQGLGI